MGLSVPVKPFELIYSDAETAAVPTFLLLLNFARADTSIFFISFVISALLKLQSARAALALVIHPT